MARSPTDPLAQLRPYLEGVAKKVADDLWGPHGPAWGTTLTDLEDVALAARAIFSQKLLELGLQRQATASPEQRPPQTQTCPDCQRPLADPTAWLPRTMQTRAGDVSWTEPRDYCPRCRRAFFPSEPKPGH
jgi:hypothetical protein